MEIHTFLLDVIKLIVTIATGILSLSIGFLDKLNIDLKVKQNRQAISLLWVFLITTIGFALVTGFSVYLDVEDYIYEQSRTPTGEFVNTRRGWQSKASFLLTLVAFMASTAYLIRLGLLMIRQKAYSKPGDPILPSPAPVITDPSKPQI